LLYLEGGCIRQDLLEGAPDPARATYPLRPVLVVLWRQGMRYLMQDGLPKVA